VGADCWVSGSRMPESSSTGTATELSSGARASSLLRARPTAYDSEDMLTESTTMKASASRMPPTGARRPITRPVRMRITDWTSRATASRMTLPKRRAKRLTGVTRMRSITPARHSAMMAKPTKREPNRPSWTRSPGTKMRQAWSEDAPGALTKCLTSGPNRVRYRIGWITPMISHAGLRRDRRICRRKMRRVSRRVLAAVMSGLRGGGRGTSLGRGRGCGRGRCRGGLGAAG
jgi:hypothetical protein